MKEEAKIRGQEQAAIKRMLAGFDQGPQKEQESENKIKFLLKENEETRMSGLP